MPTNGFTLDFSTFKEIDLENAKILLHAQKINESYNSGH